MPGNSLLSSGARDSIARYSRPLLVRRIEGGRELGRVSRQPAISPSCSGKHDVEPACRYPSPIHIARGGKEDWVTATKSRDCMATESDRLYSTRGGYLTERHEPLFSKSSLEEPCKQNRFRKIRIRRRSPDSRTPSLGSVVRRYKTKTESESARWRKTQRWRFPKGCRHYAATA